MPSDPSIPESPEPLSAIRVRQEIDAIRACPHCGGESEHDKGRITALEWVAATLDRERASRVTPDHACPCRDFDGDADGGCRRCGHDASSHVQTSEDDDQCCDGAPIRPGSRVTQPTVAALTEAALGYVALHEPDGACNGKCSAWGRLLAALPVQEATPTATEADRAE